ncbi:hypothetical protein OA07_16450 [Aphanizomenon flos-aquae 2012/KM1/D3]|nr:hypothetical protein OA07_16450 [Aphanizomenon flos-aquae 2012/KM1/D3]
MGLTFPPRAGVLIPKTQIFLWRHLPISLVFAYGIDGQDTRYLTKKSWRFLIPCSQQLIAGRVEATWLQTVEETRHEWF